MAYKCCRYHCFRNTRFHPFINTFHTFQDVQISFPYNLHNYKCVELIHAPPHTHNIFRDCQSRFDNGLLGITAEAPLGSDLPLHLTHIKGSSISGKASFVTMSRACFLPLFGLSVSPAIPSMKSSGFRKSRFRSMSFACERRATTFCTMGAKWKVGLSATRHFRANSGCASRNGVRKESRLIVILIKSHPQKTSLLVESLP